MTAPIRVLVAEDHALVRAGVRRLLGDLPGIEVVAVAADGREAVRLVAEHLPDAALMDITMPGLNGLNAMREVAAACPGVRVIMLSMHDNEEYVGHALRAGAAGYLLKDADPMELEFAIRSVARGGSFMSPSVSRQVIEGYARQARPTATSLERLTPRQVEIAQLIAEGHTNAEIARILGLANKTIEAHRTQLMARLEVHDVAGVVRYAVRMGLIPPDR